MQIVQRDEPRFAEGVPIGNEKAPFSRDRHVQHVDQAIDGEDPHEEKMISKTCGQLEGAMNRCPEAVGEKPHQGVLPQPDPINLSYMSDVWNGICPVDQQAAPDHREKNWKVDPVYPADRERVLRHQLYRSRWRSGWLHGRNFFTSARERDRRRLSKTRLWLFVAHTALHANVFNHA